MLEVRLTLSSTEGSSEVPSFTASDAPSRSDGARGKDVVVGWGLGCR